MPPSMSAPAPDNRAASPTPSQLPPVPGSPSFSLASTANPLSAYNLPLPPPPRPSHAGASLSNSFHAAASSACTADTLLSASGVHHLVANHHHILSETVYRSFEVPLLHELDKWRQVVEDEDESYAANIRDKSKEIRRLEKEGLKLHRQRRRDVNGFRAHLVDLTTKLDGLTSLHGDHARTLLRESQDTSGKIRLEAAVEEEHDEEHEEHDDEELRRDGAPAREAHASEDMAESGGVQAAETLEDGVKDDDGERGRARRWSVNSDERSE
ncbi:hypothetical protein VdG1_00404 [Verticillium dahliae VDG1]|nr:hypothetical protein VdG1_00404 [Verticillium dahliae VDG1]